MFSMLRKTSFAMALALALGPVAAHAQNVPAAPAAPADVPLHKISGFRSAHFGMNEDQVRAAVARDFKDYASLLQPARHPDARYSMLVLPLPSLEPGPGAAGVTYIFAAAEHKLVQVNVLWSTDKPGDADRARMSTAGVQLADYFRALHWRPDAATMGVPLGPNGLVLFSGIDAHKAMVEVSLTGIALRGRDGKIAPAEGPVKLRVAYMAGPGAQQAH
jgi:hypothetical protein